MATFLRKKLIESTKFYNLAASTVASAAEFGAGFVPPFDSAKGKYRLAKSQENAINFLQGNFSDRQHDTNADHLECLWDLIKKALIIIKL
jgi:hypothetical protein